MPPPHALSPLPRSAASPEAQPRWPADLQTAWEAAQACLTLAEVLHALARTPVLTAATAADLVAALRAKARAGCAAVPAVAPEFNAAGAGLVTLRYAGRDLAAANAHALSVALGAAVYRACWAAADLLHQARALLDPTVPFDPQRIRAHFPAVQAQLRAVPAPVPACLAAALDWEADRAAARRLGPEALPSAEQGYRTATQLTRLTGLSYSHLHKLCRPGGPVRWHRPNQRRLLIHAADVADHLEQHAQR
jgi:hypothetical protein